MQVSLNLNVQDVNVVLQVLGNQPTSSGLYPLAVEIKRQADEQIEASQQPVVEPAAE